MSQGDGGIEKDADSLLRRWPRRGPRSCSGGAVHVRGRQAAAARQTGSLRRPKASCPGGHTSMSRPRPRPRPTPTAMPTVTQNQQQPKTNTITSTNTKSNPRPTAILSHRKQVSSDEALAIPARGGQSTRTPSGRPAQAAARSRRRSAAGTGPD